MPELTMAELMQENGILLVAALVIAALILLWFLFSSRKTKINRDESSQDQDTIGGAKRNQALIDAAPASVKQAEIAPEQTPESVAIPATNAADDLSRIKGVGPKLKTMLIDMGITSFAEIAAWTDADIDRVDAQLGRFEGRIRRDNWPLQAQHLSSGDTAAYEAEFGRL